MNQSGKPWGWSLGWGWCTLRVELVYSEGGAGVTCEVETWLVDLVKPAGGDGKP